MLSWFWALPGGDRALSRVDPVRLAWPDGRSCFGDMTPPTTACMTYECSLAEFDRMSRILEEDMWKRQRILDAMENTMWRDYMRFFNNPEMVSCATRAIDPTSTNSEKIQYQLDTANFNKMVSSSVEHQQNGKEHIFKRSVTVNGKTDTVTAKYDGEKTVVTYDGTKTIELPGFYDITVDVHKHGSEASKAIDEKLEQMNKALRGDSNQMSIEGGGQQQQPQQQQKLEPEKKQQQQQQETRVPQQAS